MSFLGFNALGKLALGQLPTRFTDFFFNSWSQPQSKKQTPSSFTGFISVPKTTSVVFSPFSQPSSVKIQQPSQGFVVPILGTVTPSSLVFTKFSEPSFSKVRQQSNTNSSFFVQPIVAVVTGGDFANFDLVQSKKALQASFTNFTFVASPQPYVFSTFSQPQTKRVLQQNQSFVSLQVTPVVVQPVFSRFEQPSVKRVLQVDSSFVNLPVVVVVQQPYVFGQFDQPLSKRIQQADSSFVNLPIVVAPVVNFTGFIDFSVSQQKRFIDGFITQTEPSLIQTYVFSQFSQPQSKKTTNAQFTWFTSPSIAQPYVFSSFSQPFGVRYQTDSQFEFALQSIVIVTPPVFTGFNDFGLTQQSIGSQNKQDGSSVQFTVLPMPQIISVYNFTGFSDFNNQLHTSYRVEQHPQVDFFIFAPIIVPVETGPGGRRWVTELEDYKKRLKTIPLESSTIKEVTHDKDSNELVVKFKSDRVYHYRDVHPKRVKGLVKTKSPGGYLHKNIKGKYLTTRIK